MTQPTTDKPYTAWTPPDPSLPVGEEEVTRLVHTFYGKIADHPELGPIFAKALHATWDPHLAKMVDFWTTSMLGTKRYNGRPLPVHLQLPELQDHHFDQWLVLFRETAREVLPPEAAGRFIERAEHMARGFRYGVAVHRGEPLPD